MLVTYAVDALIQNPDGTITVVKEEVFSVGVLNARLTELGVRAAAVRADPDCTATIEDAGLGRSLPADCQTGQFAWRDV